MASLGIRADPEALSPDRELADHERWKSPHHYNYWRLQFYRGPVESGSIVALHEAMVLCLTKNLTVPGWLLGNSIRVIELLSPFNKRSNRGRAIDGIARDRQNYIHITRYYTVLDVRSQQTHAFEEWKAMVQEGVLGTELEAARRASEKVGRTWIAAYEFAARELKGSASFGSPSTIKTSFLLVKRLINTDAEFKFFMPYSSSFYRLGIRR